MHRGVAHQNPIRSRIRIAALVLMLPATATAQTWTEDDVATLAREASPDVRAALITASLEQARARTSGLLPNPSVQWEHQETYAPNAQGQDLVRAVVPLDVSGRPWARRALAEVDAQLATANAARARADSTEAALALFYRAIALRRVAELRARSVDALVEATRVLAARETAGEVSGYDAARLAVESELARSRLREAELEAEAARGSLAAMLAARAPARLTGDLDVHPPAPLERLLAQAVERRADLSALRDASDAAARARSAASWTWVPMLEVTGGYNRQFMPNLEGSGYMFVLSAAIPLFDFGQAERERAAAADDAVETYREALERRVAGEVRAAREQLIGVIAERQRFGEAVAAPLEIVVRAATSGYREGERTVVELVDARRAANEAAERQLALDLAARLADVRLRRLTGELE